MSTITIINKRQWKPPQSGVRRFYCGRGSALGNPFRMASEAQREAVCNQYRHWFGQQLGIANPAFHQMLADVVDAALRGPVELECYCAPKQCHCETIKAYVETHLDLVRIAEETKGMI